MMKKIFLIISSICMAAFAGCGRHEFEPVANPIEEISNNILDENQLMTTEVLSEEEAKVLAEQYGIEFVAYVEGVATFHTTEDPRIIIQKGEDEGLTPLYLNRKVKILDE